MTSEGTIEHDATIMDGRDRRAGSVASVGRIRNPISAARAVMDHTPHVLLAGAGAEQFARQQGLELAAPWYFFTQQRLDALKRVQQAATPAKSEVNEQDIHGTVGAVVLDSQGDLAAATSTGGRSNKLPGRVGDSGVVGAGTYADNRFCALSATGSGEQFSRILFANRIASLMELSKLDMATASIQALSELQAIGGSGGFVGLTSDGEPVSRFTGQGMHRGYIRLGAEPEVAIYSTERFTPDMLLV
jgi:isoaspartyl peptidase/L-asparaginase-like protein (Ntn-hydrolase superfamily)